MDTTTYQPTSLLGRILVALERLFRNISLALLMGMMLLGFSEVVSRYFFGAPIFGVKEVQTCILPVIVALSLAATQLDKSHIRMEILYDKFPKKVQLAADYLTILVSLFIWSLIAWQSIVTGNHYLENGRVVNMIRFPMAYLQYIAALGSALLCLELLRQLVHLFYASHNETETA